jgi:C-terminal processing protease CtpA/Prc
MSEGNYSDAHMFPVTYRALGIGKLVGMPVAGTGTAVWWEGLQNGMWFGIPQVGMIDNNGNYLENQQLEPDVAIGPGCRAHWSGSAVGRSSEGLVGRLERITGMLAGDH